jgi:hypothetical protein
MAWFLCHCASMAQRSARCRVFRRENNYLVNLFIVLRHLCLPLCIDSIMGCA